MGMNIRDIARLANVTPGTVSKVVNNYPDISESTRQHVLKVIEENQYIPNNNARSLKLAARIPQIGLVVEGVYNYIYETMEEMISIRLHNADYTVMSFHDNYFVQDKGEKFQELTAYADKHKLSGVVYIGGNFEQISTKQFEMFPCPLIFVNTVLPEQIEGKLYSSVQVNHFETAYRQMSYLIRKGHKEICMLISSRQDTSVYGVRVRGYLAALREHGLEYNECHIVEGDYACEPACGKLTSYLKEHGEITAVCCVADVMAVSAVRAIHNAGKVPGKEVELISFDGMDEVNYCVPSITTFEQPREELMNCVYELLQGLMSNEREHQHITFQAKLIVNESC